MKFYLIGIKGNGMTSLAMILKQDGHEVEGEDIQNFIQTEENLIKNEIKINALDSYKSIKADVYIIGHSFEDKIKKIEGNVYITYNKFLSFYLNNKGLVSICGSHGKTSMVGLMSKLIDSSYLKGDGNGCLKKDSNKFFLESCEYQDHFLLYNPEEIILLNVDFDHSDYFKNYDEYLMSFKKFLSKSKRNYIPYNLKEYFPSSITIGDNKNADFSYQNINLMDKKIEFDIYNFDRLMEHISINLKGFQYVEMITFAYAYCYINDFKFDISRLDNFKLAKRRFNIVYDKANTVIIDDYAHHPSQIKMHYKNIKYLYKKYLYIAIFEPDRYSRLSTFLDDFNDALNNFDYIYVLPLPEMAENVNKSVNIFNNNKIRYIDSINEIKLISDKKVVYSFMSSKEMKNNIDDLIKKIEKKS